jgi:hypothetical protein
MQSKIDQEVIDELVKMLEDHIAGGMKPEMPSEEAAEGDSESIPGVEHEASEAPAQEDDEELQKLMDLYSKE